MEISVNKDMVKGLMHFILLKYQEDSCHVQGTSNKNDYIGGFIDRWINRAPESIVFNEGLFKDKDYKVINDYFIYSNQSDKNAPDIIGIKCKSGDIIKFCEFNNNTWEKIDGNPYIEVKTFKKNQKLVCIKAGQQLTSNNYYVLVESNFRQNYLTSFFDNSTFSGESIANIIMDDVFIKENKDYILKKPHDVQLSTFTNDIGTLSIIGIITGEKIAEFLDIYDEKEEVIYLKSIEKKDSLDRIRGLISSDFKSIFTHVDENFYKIENNSIFNKRGSKTLRALKICVENKDKIKIRKINQKNIYIEVDGNCKINGEILNSGTYELKFEDFKRSSNWKEYIATKSFFENNILPYMKDNLEETFDKIYNDHINLKNKK